MTVLISEQTCFADVYDLGDGRVLKAFKRKPCSENQEEFDLLVKGYFWTEVEAYKKVLTTELRQYVPEFFGVVNPTELLREIPDTEQKYVAGCGYIISKLSGTEGKLRALVTNGEPSPECAERLDAIYDEIAIELRDLDADASDCSCFVQDDEQFFFIDFATWGGSPYEEQLANSGVLAQDSRAHLDNYITNCSR